MTNKDFINRYGVFPYKEFSERELVYYALFPLEKTIVKVQLVDGKETRKSCPSLLKNRDIYHNAMENLGL